MAREVLDGILLERATLRAEVDQLRGLLREIAVARRGGPAEEVDRDLADLPAEIRSDQAAYRRQAEGIESTRCGDLRWLLSVRLDEVERLQGLLDSTRASLYEERRLRGLDVADKVTLRGLIDEAIDIAAALLVEVTSDGAEVVAAIRAIKQTLSDIDED